MSLFIICLPIFGFDVRVVAVGTGQAIKNSENCDADLLIAHHKESELKLIRNGFGLYRKEFMYNDYILVLILIMGQGHVLEHFDFNNIYKHSALYV